MPIKGIKSISAGQDINPLGISEAEIIFPHPAGIIKLKVEFYDVKNCNSQQFVIVNDHLNIHGIDINNLKDRYFTIGKNVGQRFSFYLERKEINLIRQVKNANKEKFVTNQLIEAQISPELTSESKVGDLILLSTLKFHNIKGPKKVKDFFSEPFIIKALHGTNAVHVELTGQLEKKHPIFPFSLVKNYTSSDKELVPLRNETM
ncbi:hypothetical protein O181_105240 [Austropuccinia psidii MF-1]|uniref:Uncharacterized protein n=1 Tax=Austropuccinia psidii MF-1 TaxID=1389203 RepID=A0A9Q3JQ35_9BASI|nr:hypothetical protein [Austropuccinia psidii MF-1]